MEFRRDPFQAIADPVRREIIGLIAEKSMNLNTISQHFEVSRPAISRHMRILEECGLVSVKDQGRERIFTAKLQKLKQVSDWTSHYSHFWDVKLSKLQKHLSKRK
jgi:DNA-binding transcriptional ArsR family regulator